MEASDPLVSIIAICYNHESYVVETLESIHAQSYSNIQLIIVDAHSTDNSVGVIEQWLNDNEVEATFIVAEQLQNVCKNINTGLEHVKGRYFQAISCDDVMEPEKIFRQVAYMEEHPELGMVYSDVSRIDENSNKVMGSLLEVWPFYPDMPRGQIWSRLLDDNFVPAPSLLIRKEVLGKVGPYDESLSYEDYDMNLRISREFEVGYMPAQLVRYRVVLSSLGEVTLYNGQRDLVRSIARMKHMGISGQFDDKIIYEVIRSIDAVLKVDRDIALQLIDLLKEHVRDPLLNARGWLLKAGLSPGTIAKLLHRLRKYDRLYQRTDGA